jgi:hypothetical protein
MLLCEEFSYERRSALLLADISTAAPTPAALEHIWSLWKNGHRKDCGLYFHGESYGWEVQLRDDGFLEFGQRFMFKKAALRVASELRQDLERDGWNATD